MEQLSHSEFFVEGCGLQGNCVKIKRKFMAGEIIRIVIGAEEGSNKAELCCSKMFLDDIVQLRQHYVMVFQGFT